MEPSVLDNGMTILLVEPDPDLRSAIDELLEVFGYGVVAVANLDQALVAYELADGSIDGLVVSAFMPRANGLDVIDAIESRGHALPSLLISVFAANDAMLQRMATASVDYLPVPFSPRSFELKLQRLLVHSRGSRASGTSINVE
jgi:two-component system response regulator MprA